MLAIRLARVGAKKKPAYRVVVTDKRRARDSRSIEIVGHYNPTKDPIVLAFNQERLDYWLGQGAQPSDTVQRLIKYEGPRTSPAEKATEPKSAGYTAPPKPAEEPKGTEPEAAPAAAAEPEAAAPAESSAAAEPAESGAPAAETAESEDAKPE